MQHQRTVTSPAWSRSFRVSSLFSRSLYFLILTGRVPQAANWISFILSDASTRQLCPRMQSWVENTCIAKLLLRSLQEPLRTCKFSYSFSHWCQQARHMGVCTLAKLDWAFVALKCDKYQFYRFFLIDASSGNSGESLLWQKLDWAFVGLKCNKYQIFSIVFISLNASSESSGEAVHWHKLDWAFFAWKCDNRTLWDISDKTLEYQ